MLASGRDYKVCRTYTALVTQRCHRSGFLAIVASDLRRKRATGVDFGRPWQMVSVDRATGVDLATIANGLAGAATGVDFTTVASDLR